ncbi:MAG TPA: 2Fe-2S iron-sulfur cluster binding domain-containing protein [Polyangiaceae bacterium]|nr:2Fe-2S iron-sulfur cluster binding domain-containing protein [Polyangiaceae bacterium]
MIRFRGRSLELRDGESVLECLERSGEQIPSSCRSGVCQSCLMRATSGEVPPESQRGLKQTLVSHGYLLACACRPTSDLELTDGTPEECSSRVLETRRLAPGVVQVLIERPEAFEYDAGQFVHVVRPLDGLTRPYSLASLPSEQRLELHVAVRPGGAMSRWLSEATGEPVRLRGPLGECSYRARSLDAALLLIGTGTGLAPLLGVLRQALALGHRGPIELHHAASNVAGLYQWGSLCELADRHPNLELQGWVDGEAGADGPRMRCGRIDRQLLQSYAPIQHAEIYLCGSPALVANLKKYAYLQGASLDRIHADPFVTAPAPMVSGATA